jgi:taurine dioxygenase
MTTLTVRELTPALGAEVEGVDLSGPLGEAECRELREIFDDRGVLVFHDVDVPDLVQQQYLSDLLIGRAEPGTRYTSADAPTKDSYISNTVDGGIAPFGRLLWHSDMMWAPEPFQSLSLYGSGVEQPSVPTSFVSATRAWDALPDDLRTRIENLHAVQVTGQVDRGRYAEGEVLVPVRTEDTATTMPIRYQHPRTGRSILYVCEQCTLEIEEIPGDEGEAILQELFAILYDPAYVYEHQWRERDYVVWDNLATQHGRPDVATEGPDRTLRKTFSPRAQWAKQPETPRFSRTA